MTPKHHFLKIEEAEKRFIIENSHIFSPQYKQVILFDESLSIKGDFYEWFETLMKQLEREIEATLIIVDGDLQVDGVLSLDHGSFPCLLVTGNVVCDELHSDDEIIHIQGNANVKYVISGVYNDGVIQIDGELDSPYLLSSDHCMLVNTNANTVTINHFDDNKGLEGNDDYNYTVSDLEDVLDKKLLDDDEYLDVDEFIKVVRSGKSPFKRKA